MKTKKENQWKYYEGMAIGIALMFLLYGIIGRIRGNENKDLIKQSCY